jgi:hypothetical protein
MQFMPHVLNIVITSNEMLLGQFIITRYIEIRLKDHFRGIYRTYPNLIKENPEDVNM